MLRLPPLREIGDVTDVSIGGKLVCVITGPTSGIGTETAKEMFRRGYYGALCRVDGRLYGDLNHDSVEGDAATWCWFGVTIQCPVIDAMGHSV